MPLAGRPMMPPIRAHRGGPPLHEDADPYFIGVRRLRARTRPFFFLHGRGSGARGYRPPFDEE